MLSVEDLWVSFKVQGKKLPAVRGVSFSLERGDSVGIVGESGSGKSALAYAIQHLSAGEVTGNITFEKEVLTKVDRRIGMVFQDPMTALNPTMTVGAQIAEGLIYHKLMRKQEAWGKALELLQLVGVSHPEIRLRQYPHELSGGMRQRVLIAIALACNPLLLIADEPTTALDVSVQAQILDLIQRLQNHFQMSLLLISHDFGVIASICKKVLVMYAGKIVEQGSVEEILQHPKHPYTQLLLQALPRLDRPHTEPLIPIEGSPPNLLHLPKGCAFQERCPYAALKCQEEPQGVVACWRAQ